MRSIRTLITAVLFASLGSIASASSSLVVVDPGQEVWKTQPDKSSVAVLYGNPAASGYYAMRIKFPPNWSEGPHYHPLRENASVISGSVYLGIGTKFDKSKATKYTAGAFASIPAKLAHYAFTTTEGAVVQIDGVGPFQEIMIK
jgi:quercetin dioxygenase-like cupin family protein